MKHDMNDRLDNSKAFWIFITLATLAGAVFIVLSSGVTV